MAVKQEDSSKEPVTILRSDEVTLEKIRAARGKVRIQVTDEQAERVQQLLSGQKHQR